jgi:hypothetical protein
VNLRGRICYLLARLRIHSPDCAHCSAREACGSDLLKRLEELNWRTLKTEQVEEVPDSKATTEKGDRETKLSA